jgi:SAM-dependent methyltransferase
MTGSPDATITLNPDCVLRLVDGAWIISNPRVREHMEFDAQALVAVQRCGPGAPAETWKKAFAEAIGWDRTEPFFLHGLWSDPSSLASERGQGFTAEILFKVLMDRFFLLEMGASDYRDFLAPRESALDRRHLGSFHQILGHHLVIEQRLRETWRWWHDQKFTDDGQAIRPGPYRFVQEAFFDSYFGSRNLAGETILDFACGNGHFARRFASRGARVIGVDTNSVLIERAIHNHGSSAEFHCADSHEKAITYVESLAVGSIDRIYMSDIFLLLVEHEEQFHDGGLARLLAAFRHVLAPRGVLQMMEPNAIAWLACRGGSRERPYLMLTEYRRPVYNPAPTLDRVMQMMGNSGFALSEYRLPEIDDTECDDPTLISFASEFPLWDFLTFIVMPGEGNQT